jgi:TIR domain
MSNPLVSGSGASAPRPPRIFVSYASADSDYLAEFKRDLEHQLETSSLAAHPHQKPHVFLAGDDIDGGNVWLNRLKHELDSCDLFIPICTPSFFRSRWCAREWGYFRRRLLAATPIEQEPPERIIPVWWRPLDPLKRLPAIVEPIEMGVDTVKFQRRQGVVEWAMRSRDRGEYPLYVLGLARRVLKALGEGPASMAPLGIKLTEADEAFVGEWSLKDAVQSNLVYVVPSASLLEANQHVSSNGLDKTVYGDAPSAWQGFGPGRAGSQATHWTMEEVCPARRVDWMLRKFNILPGEPPLTPPKSWAELGSQDKDSPTVVLCDSWAIDQGYFRDWLYRELAQLAESPNRHLPYPLGYLAGGNGVPAPTGPRDAAADEPAGPGSDNGAEHPPAGTTEPNHVTRHRVFIVAGTGHAEPVYTFDPVNSSHELTSTLYTGLLALRHQHGRATFKEVARRSRHVVNPFSSPPAEPPDELQSPEPPDD